MEGRVGGGPVRGRPRAVVHAVVHAACMHMWCTCVAHAVHMRWAAHAYLPEDAEAAEACVARRVSIHGVGEEVLDRGHGDHVANVLALLVGFRVRVRVRVWVRVRVKG